MILLNDWKIALKKLTSSFSLGCIFEMKICSCDTKFLLLNTNNKFERFYRFLCIYLYYITLTK